MSGHSKWANIQHRKGRQDAKRGKVFTKAALGVLAALAVLDIGPFAVTGHMTSPCG